MVSWFLEKKSFGKREKVFGSLVGLKKIVVKKRGTFGTCLTGLKQASRIMSGRHV